MKNNMHTILDTFWERVAIGDGCWNWTGYTNRKGYGLMALGWKRPVMFAHRFSWIIDRKREVPNGLMICHTCDNPKCVRPEHLYAGTAKDNSRDLVERGHHSYWHKSACVHGHPFTPENTYVVKATGFKHCKTCKRERMRRARQLDRNYGRL